MEKLGIGYIEKKYHIREDGVRIIEDTELIEISIIK